MGVPNVFGSATTSIPLSQLDQNFNTGLTIGNTTVGLGNTVTTLGNVTLTNVNIVSGTVPVPTSIANGTSNVSISSSGGNINVVTGGTIATFPAATGTVMVSGNMPAFSAYLSTNQNVTTGTWTKIAYDVKVFDTNNNFASSRFTPTVAGYYQITGVVRINSYSVSSIGGIGIYKNGSQYSLALTALSTGTFAVNGQVISEIVYCNGSTDYIEMYGFDTSANTPFFDGGSGSQYVRISGALVRTA